MYIYFLLLRAPFSFFSSLSRSYISLFDPFFSFFSFSFSPLLFLTFFLLIVLFLSRSPHFSLSLLISSSYFSFSLPISLIFSYLSPPFFKFFSFSFSLSFFVSFLVFSVKSTATLHLFAYTIIKKIQDKSVNSCTFVIFEL
jgi:hypothetical protein